MLTLSREGDLTSESKGIVDSLRMTYDGMRLAAVHDYAAVPSVATSDGLVVQGNQFYPFGMSFATNKPVNDITEEQVNIDLNGNVIGGGDAGGFIPGGGALSGGEGVLIPQAALLLAEQPYRFGGKELYSSTGTYDFLARQYDPALCRFTTPDPLAAKYPSISPYAYCGNDPVNKVDPDGRKVVIWYQDNGNYHSYHYSGGDCKSNNDYVLWQWLKPINSVKRTMKTPVM